MNCLILSVGSRNKIVEYFKKDKRVKNVICTDCSEYAPAIYIADKYYITPRITDKNYLDIVLDICKKESIKFVFSLIDPELLLLSENKERFIEIGTIPIISDLNLIQLSFNKFLMYNFIKEKGFNTQLTFDNIEDFEQSFNNKEISFPIFVKPTDGSASIGLSKIDNLDVLKSNFINNGTYIIQEFMDSKEYGVDVYIDMISKKVINVFIKEKIKMRAGETDKSKSIVNNNLTNMIVKFVETAGFIGVIDIDVFEKNGQYYISEVNPRFGGGYPHAYECGCRFPELIVNNILGLENSINISNYKENIVLMKYSDFIVR